MDPATASALVNFGLAASAASAAEAATYPLDFVKTRVQSASKKVSPFKTLLSVARDQGMKTLYGGIGAAVARHWVYSTTKILIFEQLRAESQKREMGLGGLALSAACAGGIGQFLASPTDLVKVRQQTGGAGQGATDCMRALYREGGLSAFWKGWSPNVQRAILVNVGELLAYDNLKKLLLKHTPLSDALPCHMVASFGAGVLASLCSCPADVIKTRLMVGSGSYRGTLDCASKIVRTEGPRALYKGFLPTWMRLGPWQFVFWVSYEQGRRWRGMEGF